MIDVKPPQRLYKYQSFSNYTIPMLVENKVYFADPNDFNDPLDTKPTVNPDIDIEALKNTLTRLIGRRVEDKMSAAMNTIKARGPKADAHIARQCREAAEEVLAEIRHYAEDKDAERSLLGREVQAELLRRYDKGIFCLAKRANCPLMWSHYGDKHRGICLGYSIPDAASGNVRKVQYGGSRLVAASAVADMLGGDESARRRVDDAVLLTKAKPWHYEKEWRLFGPRGEQSSPLKLEEIVFGMRCPESTKYVVAKALTNRDISVPFHEIHAQPDSFRLKKRTLDTRRLFAEFPRSGAEEDFEVIPGDF